MIGRNDIACRDVVELLTDYLDGALTPDDRARLELHLGECGGCARALSQLRETIRLTGTLTEDRVPPELRTAIRDAFRVWRSGT